MKKIQLTNEQSKLLYSWISNNLHDMEVDEEFIDEEEPGLIGAIKCLKDQL